MGTLSQWTKGHACTSNFCYTVMGLMQFMGDIQGDIRNCKADFQASWGNFTQAYKDLYDSKANSSGGGDFHWDLDAKHIAKGVKDIGYAMKDVAKGVGDCHLAELADILEKLAVKLGIAPEVQWVEEVLKVLIEGVHIEQEVGDACLDYGQGNWVGFGYN